MSFKGMLIKAGISVNGEVATFKSGIKVLDALTLVETGYDAGVLFQHGTSDNALAYGTQTEHMIMKSLSITGAVTGHYIIGDLCKIATSAASTGHIFAGKNYIVVAHNTGAVRALYNQIDINATAVLNENIQGLKSGIDINAGAITGVGKICGITVEVDVVAGSTVANHIYGIEVDMRDIKVDTAGDKVGIKVTMAGGSNYLDYGMVFSNCFNTATAVMWFDLTQGNTAKGILMASGAFTITTGIDIGAKCTTAIDVSIAQAAGSGYDNAAVFQHGTATTALVYGTQTNHLILKSMSLTVATTGKYVIGDLCKITTSATSTGHIHARKTLVLVGHNTGNVRCNYNEVDITATALLNENVQAIKAEIDVEAGVITGVGKICGVTVEMVVLPAVTSIANVIHGIEVDMRGIKKDTAGETIGIKVTMAGGSNYLDYGMQFSNCFDTATAVVNFDLTQGNTACVQLIESGAFTITNAFSFTGLITTLMHFGATGAGIVHGGAAAAAVTGYLKVMVGTTAYRIPYLADSDA